VVDTLTPTTLKVLQALDRERLAAIASYDFDDKVLRPFI